MRCKDHVYICFYFLYPGVTIKFYLKIKNQYFYVLKKFKTIYISIKLLGLTYLNLVVS